MQRIERPDYWKLSKTFQQFDHIVFYQLFTESQLTNDHAMKELKLINSENEDLLVGFLVVVVVVVVAVAVLTTAPNQLVQLNHIACHQIPLQEMCYLFIHLHICSKIFTTAQLTCSRW